MYECLNSISPLIETELAVHPKSVIENLIEEFNQYEIDLLYELSNGDAVKIESRIIYFGDIYPQEHDAIVILLGNEGEIVLHKNKLKGLPKSLQKVFDRINFHRAVIITSEYGEPLNTLPRDLFSFEVIPNGGVIMFDNLDPTNPFLRIGLF